MKNKRTKSQLRHHPQNNNNQATSFGTLNKSKNDNFKFISQDYSKYLNCPLCKQLMIRPMRFHPCGHTFCLKCSEPFISTNKKVCPIVSCLLKCLHIQEDRTAQRLIDELKVQCKNEGCVWKGEYQTYKKTHKDSCILKNGGLGQWLSELRGMDIRSRQDFEDQQEKRQQQEKAISRSQRLLRNINGNIVDQQIQINQDLSLDQIQEEQRNNHIERLAQVYQNESDSEKKDFLAEIQKVEVQNRLRQNLSPPKQIKLENKNDLSVQKESQKVQSKQISQSYADHSVPQDISRRVNNNNFIFNLPFGPSLEQQTNIVVRKKSNHIKKELKKLQS